MGRRNVRSFLLGISLAWLSSFLHAKGPDQYLDVFDFSKGLDSYHGTTSLPDGTVQDALNGYFDDKAPFTKRAGYTVAWSTKTYAFTSAWTYVDNTNTFWQIVRSSDQITASNLAGSVVKVSTVSSNDTVGFAAAFGSAYFVDPTQGVYYWNGTSTSYVANSPHGSIISQFHNRLWVAGAAVPNGNQLYGSKYYDGTTWTTGINATDPVQYSIGLNDNFDVLTALYVYLDTLYTFKKFSIYTLTGFDQTNFNISQITQECGCIDTNSIQTYNGGLKLVSLRGVENFDGYHCTRISDQIKNLVDPAIQSGAFSQLSWVQSTQADWQSGTISPTNSLSTTLSAPALVLQSTSGIYNSAATFAQGTLNQLSWNGSGLGLTISNTNYTNSSFDSGTSGWYTGSGFTSVGTFAGTHCTINPQAGSGFGFNTYGVSGGLTANITAYLKNCKFNTILASVNFDVGSNNCSWTQHTLSGSGLGARCIFIDIIDGTNSRTITTSNNFIASGSDITFYTASDNYNNGINNVVAMGLDTVANGMNLYSSGTFTSPTLDNVATNNTMLGQGSWTTPDNSDAPTLIFQNSSDASTWFDVTRSTGINTTSSRRYSRFISSITQQGNDDVSEQLNSLQFNVSATSGSLKSASHAMGALNSFGNFAVTDTLTSGATIAFSICSSSNSNMVPMTCANQSPNTQITISTATGGTQTYVQWYSTFSVTAATQTTTLNNVTVQSYIGTRATPMASTVWDNRYWLALTTNTADSANDAVLVLNRFNVWTKFSIHAGGFTQYKNNLYHSDSLASGNIYLDGQAFADNGSAIDAYVRTKDFSLGDISRDSYLYAIYPSLDNLGSCSVSFSYYPDRSSTAYNLGSPTQTEFASAASVRLPIPLDSSHQDFGRTFNFKIDSNDASCGLQLYGFRGLYKARPNN